MTGKSHVYRFPLRHVTHQMPLPRIRLTVDLHFAASQRNQAQHRLDERALAGAVGADNADQLALGRDQVNVPQHRLAVVGHGHIVDFKRRSGHVEIANFGLWIAD